jgi:membrane protease YdiL (CAAX protease family)
MEPLAEQRGSPMARESAASLAVPWTLRQTLIGAGLTVVPLVVLLAATRLSTSPHPASAPLPVAVDRLNAVVAGIASALVEGVFLIAPLYYALARRHGVPVAGDLAATGEGAPTPGWRALGLRAFNVARALALLVAGYAAIYLFGLVYSLLRVPTNVETLLREARLAPLTVLATLLVAVVVAPVCEEIFFRGFLLPGLARGMPVWAAVVVSALVFGVAHADPGSFLPLVAIGLVLGALRVWTGSVWPGMLLHALNNLAAAIFVISLLHH